MLERGQRGYPCPGDEPHQRQVDSDRQDGPVWVPGSLLRGEPE